jgi:hypothetical protein
LLLGLDGFGEKVFVSVLRTTDSNRSAADVARSVSRARSLLPGLIEGACDRDSKPDLIEAPAGSGRSAFVGSCDGVSRRGDATHYLHYELHSKRGIVQLHAAGQGSVSAARELFDPVIADDNW